MNREHVLPSWMSKYFADLTGSTVTGFIDADDADVAVYDLEGPTPGRIVNAKVDRTLGAAGTFNHTVRKTCEGCNGGWMGRLEQSIEPLLGPMFWGQPQLLTDYTATMLAEWVVKTVLIANVGFADVLSITPFHELYAAQRASPRTVVWCAYRHEFSIQIGSMPLQSRATSGSGALDGLHATVWLGHVVFGMRARFGPPTLVQPLVLFSPQQRWLWPLNCIRERSWPPPEPLSDMLMRQWIDPPYDRIARPI